MVALGMLIMEQHPTETLRSNWRLARRSLAVRTRGKGDGCGEASLFAWRKGGEGAGLFGLGEVGGGGVSPHN